MINNSMQSITKFEKTIDPLDAYVARMWILWCSVPGRETRDAAGALDLGEVGSVAEKNWYKASVYSPAEVTR
jgi:hypothetical protein